MDAKLLQDLEDCFGYCGGGCYGNPQEACKIIKENKTGIDFDDDEDMEELAGLIERALFYEDGDGNQREEEGVDFLRFLIEQGFDINFRLEKGQSLLLRLTEKTEIAPELFQKIVDLGADVYAENTYGDTVLSLAIENIRFKDQGEESYPKTSQRLPLYIIEAFGIEAFDHTNSHGMTPLMCAVLTNKQRVAKLLLERGAAVDATGGEESYDAARMYGVSPFALACREGNLEMAKMLLDAGADEALCDAEGTPAMFSLLYRPACRRRVCEECKADIVPLLKNPDCTDSDGNTLLIGALTLEEYSSSGKELNPDRNEEIIHRLLARGVDVNARNNDGESALYMAVNYCGEFMELLLEAGADVNIQDSDGETALMIACQDYNEEAACCLIEHGADIRLKNRRGKTAVDIAIKNGLTQVLELMV